MRFETLREVTTLPWFDLAEDGKILVVDPEVGPAIDVHTHLALAFLRKPAELDRSRDGQDAQHYLPLDSPHDLEGYANLNFTPEQLTAMRRDLPGTSFDKGEMAKTHTADNLLAEMAGLGIEESILLPIDLPGPSRNAERYLDVASRHDGLSSFGSVHPMRWGMLRHLDRQRELGARGIKFHPAVQLMKPSARRARRLYHACGERCMAVFWHCGPVDIEPPLGRYMSQVRHYERAIAETPGTTFVLGHSGALQIDEGLDLAGRYPNVLLDLSSQSLTNVRRMLDEGFGDRLMFGSDWPFYHQALPLAKVLLATEGDPATRRKVLYDNARTMLERHRPDASTAA